MGELIVSVSGIRGIVGENLFPETAQRFGLAFGTFLKGRRRVVVGTDTRLTRHMMKSAVISGLLGTGCDVIDVDIAPTPTVQFLVRDMKLDGGIVISASHNPIEWNALKLYKRGGVLLNRQEGEAVKKIFEKNRFAYVTWEGTRTLVSDPALAGRHVKRVLESVDAGLIRKKKFKVALDSCNASGSFITRDLLEQFGCQVRGLYVTPDGLFPHSPEPNMNSLQDMVRFMKKGRYDIGFAQDSDADRLALLDENGRFLSEEYTLALAVRYVLSEYEKNRKFKRYKKSVVVNLSTSRMIEDIAAEFNARVFRTSVGEINVVEKLMSSQSVIGGEGNGGVIFPEVNFGRDSLAGIGLVLNQLARSGEKLSVLLERIPRYIMVKTKFNVEHMNIRHIVARIKNDFSKGEIDEQDGIKISFPDYWVHMRSSNTEPILRLIIESKNKNIINEVLRTLGNYLHQS